MTTPIRVLLVDDQLLFRKGLRALLEDQEDMEVVGEASDGLQGAGLVETTHPDVVIMDLNMPVCDGIEGTRIIKSQYPDVAVIMLTVSDEEEELFAAIKNGAGGYLLKDLKPEELFASIRGVMKGESPIGPALATKLLREFRSRTWRDDDAGPERALTSRELEVLQLVTEGRSNAEIAATLYIVEGTVKNHLHNILEKLHLENRLQAATYAIRQGLVQVPKRQQS